MKLAMIAASLILAGSAQAQSPEEKNVLSEQCGKLASEVFGKSGKSQQASNYEYYYNSRLDKCFYVVTTSIGRQMQIGFLYDLNENRGYGGYIVEGDLPRGILQCYVQDAVTWRTTRCASEEEWRALIKPFMEE